MPITLKNISTSYPDDDTVRIIYDKVVTGGPYNIHRKEYSTTANNQNVNTWAGSGFGLRVGTHITRSGTIYIREVYGLQVAGAPQEVTPWYEISYNVPRVADITNLSVSYTGSSARFSWNVSGSNYDGIEISFNYNPLNPNNSTWTLLSASTRRYTTGTTSGAFYVRAVKGDTAGITGAASIAFNRTPHLLPRVPASISVSDDGSGNATVSWTPPTSDGRPAPTGYRVRNSAAPSVVTTKSAGSRSHTYNGIATGRTYTFYVSAVNVNGAGREISRSHTLGGVPEEEPQNLTGQGFETQIDWTWNAPTDTPVTDYEMRLRKTGENWGTPFSIGSTNTNHRTSGLDQNSSYEAEVRGVNSAGSGTWSDIATATTRLPAWEEVLRFSNVADISDDTYKSIIVTHDRIYLTRGTNANDFGLEAFTHAGVAVSGEDRAFGIYTNGRLEAIIPFGKNRIIGVYGDATEGVGGRSVVIRDFAENQGVFGAFEPHDGEPSGGSTHNELKDIKSVTAIPRGLLISDGGDSALDSATTDAGIYQIDYDKLLDSLVSNTEDTRPAYSTVSVNAVTRNSLIAAVRNLVFISTGETSAFQAYTDDMTYIAERNISPPSRHDSEDHKDLTSYGKHLWLLTSKRILKVDITKAVAPRPKQTIYPQFVEEGGSLDLLKFCEGADEIVWDTGYSKPSYLSIDSRNRLQIGSVSADTTVLIKLRGINTSDASVLGTFEFYLTILADASPIWEDVENVPMATSDVLKVFRLVKNADSVAWKNGFTVPSELDLSDGKLSFDGVPDGIRLEVQLTATNTHGSSHKTFFIDVIKTSRQVSYSDTFRYRVEIEGIDVTDDLIIGEDGEGNARDSVYRVTENLDVVRINSRTVGDCQLTLDNPEGRYNSYIADNFWAANNLNPGGYQSEIKLFVDNLVDGTYQAQLLFSGIIIETWENISAATIELTCVDESYQLRNASLGTIGLQKQAHLFRQDDENYEGIYTPEQSLLPILAGSGSAVSGQTGLTIKSTVNRSEGVLTTNNSAFISASDLRTSGGYIEERPLLKFRTQYQKRKAKFVIEALAAAARLWNASVNVALPNLEDRFLTNQGSIGFNVEKTRITRLPVDWIHDTTNDCLFILLSSFEAHVSDQLVRYDIGDDQYWVLYEFDMGVAVHRLASSDFDTFYILATDGGYIDTSAVPRPPITEDISSQYDSVQTDKTKIIRYVVSTDTETSDFVASTNSRSPQVGLHYFVGFANKHTLHEFEALVPDDRSAFEMYSSQLYYRYATGSAFGVARVNASGTTTALFSETPDNYYNAQNFAFDIAGNGDVYFAYCSGGEYDENTTLTIKRRTSDGTVTTILSDSKALHELTDIDEVGGAYAGVHEVLYHNNNVYLVVEVQRVRYENEDDESNTDRYRKFHESAGAVFYRVNTTGTAELTVIQTYDFVHFSCRSLTVFDSEVYFLENPAVSYQFRPINAELESYNESTGYNLLPEETGALKKIGSNDIVETIGALWYEDTPYYGVQTRCLVFNEQLHVIVGYSRSDELLRANATAAKPDNFQWISYGKQLDYVLPEIPSDGTIFGVLEDIALKTGTLFSMNQSLIQIYNVEPLRAKVNGVIRTTIPFDGENRDFPTEGYLIIGSEIIGYTGISSSAFTGLTRGVLGSTVATHADNSDILYLDNIINASSLNDPYRDIRIRLDTNRFYNVVRDSEGITEHRDTDSIETYSERIYDFDIGLTRHEAAWIDHLGDRLLTDLKELRYLVEITLVPSNYIRLGDIISFSYAGQLLIPNRVVSITYAAESTQIIGRSV